MFLYYVFHLVFESLNSRNNDKVLKLIFFNFQNMAGLFFILCSWSTLLIPNIKANFEREQVLNRGLATKSLDDISKPSKLVSMDGEW